MNGRAIAVLKTEWRSFFKEEEKKKALEMPEIR